MTAVAPIRPGIEPEIDAAREMRDWAWQLIADHMESGGVAPDSIAMVVIGRNQDGEPTSTCRSWSPKNVHSQMMTCSLASTRLLKRAMDG